MVQMFRTREDKAAYDRGKPLFMQLKTITNELKDMNKNLNNTTSRSKPIFTQKSMSSSMTHAPLKIVDKLSTNFGKNVKSMDRNMSKLFNKQSGMFSKLMKTFAKERKEESKTQQTALTGLVANFEIFWEKFWMNHPLLYNLQRMSAKMGDMLLNVDSMFGLFKRHEKFSAWKNEYKISKMSPMASIVSINQAIHKKLWFFIERHFPDFVEGMFERMDSGKGGHGGSSGLVDSKRIQKELMPTSKEHGLQTLYYNTYEKYAKKEEKRLARIMEDKGMTYVEYLFSKAKKGTGVMAKAFQNIVQFKAANIVISPMKSLLETVLPKSEFTEAVKEIEKIGMPGVVVKYGIFEPIKSMVKQTGIPQMFTQYKQWKRRKAEDYDLNKQIKQLDLDREQARLEETAAVELAKKEVDRAKKKRKKMDSKQLVADKVKLSKTLEELGPNLNTRQLGMILRKYAHVFDTEEKMEEAFQSAYKLYGEQVDDTQRQYRKLFDDKIGGAKFQQNYLSQLYERLDNIYKLQVDYMKNPQVKIAGGVMDVRLIENANIHKQSEMEIWKTLVETMFEKYLSYDRVFVTTEDNQTDYEQAKNIPRKTLRRLDKRAGALGMAAFQTGGKGTPSSNDILNYLSKIPSIVTKLSISDWRRLAESLRYSPDRPLTKSEKRKFETEMPTVRTVRDYVKKQSIANTTQGAVKDVEFNITKDLFPYLHKKDKLDKSKMNELSKEYYNKNIHAIINKVEKEAGKVIIMGDFASKVQKASGKLYTGASMKDTYKKYKGLFSSLHLSTNTKHIGRILETLHESGDLNNEVLTVFKNVMYDQGLAAGVSKDKLDEMSSYFEKLGRGFDTVDGKNVGLADIQDHLKGTERFSPEATLRNVSNTIRTSINTPDANAVVNKLADKLRTGAHEEVTSTIAKETFNNKCTKISVLKEFVKKYKGTDSLAFISAMRDLGLVTFTADESALQAEVASLSADFGVQLSKNVAKNENVDYNKMVGKYAGMTSGVMHDQIKKITSYITDTESPDRLKDPAKKLAEKEFANLIKAYKQDKSPVNKIRLLTAAKDMVDVGLLTVTDVNALGMMRMTDSSIGEGVAMHAIVRGSATAKLSDVIDSSKFTLIQKLKMATNNMRSLFKAAGNIKVGKGMVNQFKSLDTSGMQQKAMEGLAKVTPVEKLLQKIATNISDFHHNTRNTILDKFTKGKNWLGDAIMSLPDKAKGFFQKGIDLHDKGIDMFKSGFFNWKTLLGLAGIPFLGDTVSLVKKMFETGDFSISGLIKSIPGQVAGGDKEGGVFNAVSMAIKYGLVGSVANFPLGTLIGGGLGFTMGMLGRDKISLENIVDYADKNMSSTVKTAIGAYMGFSIGAKLGPMGAMMGTTIGMALGTHGFTTEGLVRGIFSSGLGANADPKLRIAIATAKGGMAGFMVGNIPGMILGMAGAAGAEKLLIALDQQRAAKDEMDRLQREAKKTNVKLRKYFKNEKFLQKITDSKIRAAKNTTKLVLGLVTGKDKEKLSVKLQKVKKEDYAKFVRDNIKHAINQVKKAKMTPTEFVKVISVLVSDPKEREPYIKWADSIVDYQSGGSVKEFVGRIALGATGAFFGSFAGPAGTLAGSYAGVKASEKYFGRAANIRQTADELLNNLKNEKVTKKDGGKERMMNLKAAVDQDKLAKATEAELVKMSAKLTSIPQTMSAIKLGIEAIENTSKKEATNKLDTLSTLMEQLYIEQEFLIKRGYVKPDFFNKHNIELIKGISIARLALEYSNDKDLMTLITTGKTTTRPEKGRKRKAYRLMHFTSKLRGVGTKKVLEQFESSYAKTHAEGFKEFSKKQSEKDMMSIAKQFGTETIDDFLLGMEGAQEWKDELKKLFVKEISKGGNPKEIMESLKNASGKIFDGGSKQVQLMLKNAKKFAGVKGDASMMDTIGAMFKQTFMNLFPGFFSDNKFNTKELVERISIGMVKYDPVKGQYVTRLGEVFTKSEVDKAVKYIKDKTGADVLIENVKKSDAYKAGHKVYVDTKKKIVESDIIKKGINMLKTDEELLAGPASDWYDPDGRPKGTAAREAKLHKANIQKLKDEAGNRYEDISKEQRMALYNETIEDISKEDKATLRTLGIDPTKKITNIINSMSEKEKQIEETKAEEAKARKELETTLHKQNLDKLDKVINNVSNINVSSNSSNSVASGGGSVDRAGPEPHTLILNSDKSSESPVFGFTS